MEKIYQECDFQTNRKLEIYKHRDLVVAVIEVDHDNLQGLSFDWATEIIDRVLENRNEHYIDEIVWVGGSKYDGFFYFPLNGDIKFVGKELDWNALNSYIDWEELAETDDTIRARRRMKQVWGIRLDGHGT
jgi:hypothetical protein